MKSRRTKALEISQDTKRKVWERQNGVSLFSGTPISVSECCCHFISRAKGGLGIPENILGMTYREHMIFDNNVIGGSKEQSEKMREIALQHLKTHYPDWDIQNVTYRR